MKVDTLPKCSASVLACNKMCVNPIKSEKNERNMDAGAMFPSLNPDQKKMQQESG